VYFRTDFLFERYDSGKHPFPSLIASEAQLAKQFHARMFKNLQTDLQGGVDTLIGERGVSSFGGSNRQRYRLSLRAILADPENFDLG